MSDLVAEMVLGACGDVDSGPECDAAALEAARSVTIAPSPSQLSPAPTTAPHLARRRVRVAAFAVLGTLVVVGSVLAAFLVLR